MIFFSIALLLTLVKLIYNLNYLPDIRNIGDYINGTAKVIIKTIDVAKQYSPNAIGFIEMPPSTSVKQDDETYEVKEVDIEEPKITIVEKEAVINANKISEEELEKMFSSLFVSENSLIVNPKGMNLATLANKNLKVNFQTEKPKILIFHTHSQETFIDSRPGVEEDSVIGVGDRLVEVLYEKYGLLAIHDRGKYDVFDGKLSRDGSYTRASQNIERILKENPQIEVIIDIHRDGIPDNKKLVSDLNGKQTAKLMFVNGMCEKITDGKMQKIKNLENKYINDNLAFSLQMQLESNKLYPNLMRRILLKPYRYSLYMKPKSLLVEVGAQTNTVSEAKNAMEPLAAVLAKVVNQGNNK